MRERSQDETTTVQSGETFRIVLVDDHPIVLQGLARLIQQEPDLCVCAEASDEPAAWDAISKHRPDLVIVDISLKSGDGIDLIKRIRGAYPNIAILVMSMHDESHYIERALRAGAWGYLTKLEASDNVLVAIRKVLSGAVYFDDRLSPTLLERLLSGTPGKDDSIVNDLSDREWQVFRLIGSGHGVQEIAEDLHLSVKTIETYQAHIKEKLNLKDTRKLVQFAIRWTLSQEQK